MNRVDKPSDPVALCKSKPVTTDEIISVLAEANLREGTVLSLKSFSTNTVVGLSQLCFENSLLCF